MKRIILMVAVFGLTVGLGISEDRAPAQSLVLPPGTILHVKLDTTLTSKTNKPGDSFTGEVTQDVLNGKDVVVAQGSGVTGHVAFIKPSGRIKGKAQMRIVLDSITTPDEQKIALSSTLEDTKGGVCGNAPNDDEGTITGCGKSKKDAAKDAGIAAAMGAGVGATVGMGHEIDCAYFGNCGGPGMGTDIMYGAGAGAATALLYNLFKHEKQIILVEGTELTFVVNRTLDASNPNLPRAASAAPATNAGSHLL